MAIYQIEKDLFYLVEQLGFEYGALPGGNGELGVWAGPGCIEITIPACPPKPKLLPQKPKIKPRMTGAYLPGVTEQDVQNLHELLEKRDSGFSLKQLARIYGRSTSNIHALICGKAQPRNLRKSP